MEFVRKEIEVSSPEETFNIAKEFAESAPAGTVIALIGDLGVGKTVFTKGLAKGLGIDDDVVSPTFTIMMYTESEMYPRWKKSDSMSSHMATE